MFFLNGFILGLSTGVFCLSWCIPVYAPLVLVEERTWKKSLVVFLKFSLGRLIGYLLFGAAVGFLGAYLNAGLYRLIISMAMIILSALMIAYALGLTIPETKFCHFFRKIKVAFWLGFLTGLNVCPPFLLALTQGLNLADILRSVLFFFFFFLGTSVYIFPLTFLGFLSNKKILRQIARVSAIIVGLVFLVQGLKGL